MAVSQADDTDERVATAVPPAPGAVRRLAGGADPILVALVVAAGVLRFWGLGAQSLWYDEWLTSEASSGGLADLLRHVARREGIPPTYFALSWGWVRLFGDGEAALRAISALAGIATVPVGYAIAVQLRLDRRVARVTALLLAVHPMLAWYAQEARPYSLVALLGGLSFLTFARVWCDGHRRDVAAWGLVSAAMVAVHYFAVFLVAAEALALLARRPAERRSVLLSTLPTLVVLAALVPVAARQHVQEANRRWIAGFPLAERLREAGRSALVGPSPPDHRLWIIVALVVALATVLVATRAASDHRRMAVLAAAVGGTAVLLPIAGVIAGAEDVVVGRYLIASLAPLVVAVAVGLAATKPRWVGATATIVVGTLSLGIVVAVQRDPALQKPDWRAVADAFGSSGEDRVLVLSAHGEIASPLLSYLGDPKVLTGDDIVRVDEIDVLSIKPTERPCNFLVGRACAFFFLGGPPPDPLGTRLTLAERVELDQFTLDRYRVDGGPMRVTKADVVPTERLAAALVVVPGVRPP